MDYLIYIFMKRIWFFLIGLGCIPMFCEPAFSATPRELKELDRYVESKKDYDAKKSRRIEALKAETRLVENDERLFESYMELGREFTLFRADSAIIYYNKAIQAAERTGDTLKSLRARMKKVRPEMIAGFYAEAHDEFRLLGHSYIPDSLQSEFFECGYRIYSFALNSLEEGSQFYDTYYKNTEEYRQKWISSLPEGSVTRRLYEVEQATWDGKNMAAKVVLGDLLSELKTDTNEFALASAFLAKILKAEGKDEESMKYYALSAISDIQCSVKENQSIYDLSMMLYATGDIDRAYRYIFSSIEDAAFCNAQLRVYNASAIFPMIESAQREEIEAHERMLMSYILISCVLLVGLVITVLFLVKQMKRLTVARQTLKHANMTKDEYMGQFLELCSIYMKRLDSFTKTVNRKLTSGQVDDLIKMMKSSKFSEEQHGKFYGEFDNAFLKIYTTFVADLNALLRPEERIIIDEPGVLTTELRIYALLRLGIEDSSKIAEFLRYSVNTIYTYRNRMKNRAINRETFEADVMKIGVIE